MNAELKKHHTYMETMLGDDFKPFSQRASQPNNKKMFNGNFNTIKSVIGDDNLPEIPKKNEQAAG